MRLVTATFRFALLGVLAARPAIAGDCEPDCEQREVENLEHRAASKTAAGDDTFSIFIKDNAPTLATTEPRLVARIVKACDAILAVKPDDPSCVDLAAQLGKADIGTHDIVAALGRRTLKFTDRRTISDSAAVASARMEPIVIAWWKQLAPDLAKRERDADAMNDWAAWRVLAAQALAAGGDAARAFLADQIAQPKLDRGVKRACQRAVDAIDARKH